MDRAAHPAADAAAAPFARSAVTTGRTGLGPPTERSAAWRTFQEGNAAHKVLHMSDYFYTAWERVAATPDEIWAWFGRLNREEWLVTLAIVCACGFVSLLGFRSQRL
jgi:hypothetical protein